MSTTEILFYLSVCVSPTALLILIALVIRFVGDHRRRKAARGGDLDKDARVLKEERQYDYLRDKPPAIGQHVMLRLPDQFLERDFGATVGATGIVREHTRDAYDTSVVSGVLVQWLTQGERNDPSDPDSTCRSDLKELVWISPDSTIVSPRTSYGS